MTGTGFLVQTDDDQVYLVTAAHVATGVIKQDDVWSQWADTLIFHDQLQNELGRVPLFSDDEDGNRVPVFHYGRMDDPGRILDLIMVPLPAPELLLAAPEAFRPFLPVTVRVDEPAAIVGCHDWPRVNTKHYFVRGATDGSIALYIDPASEKGESGGPLLSMSGELLGVNYASDHPDAPGLGLVLNAELIRLIASADEGYMEGQQRPDCQATTSPS
jgi:hypothetical protein